MAEAVPFEKLYREMIEHERDRAIAELTALTEIRPNWAPGWAMLATAHHRCLDFAACATASRRLLELQPKHSTGLHTLALSLMAQGDYEGALEAYRRAGQATGSLFAGTTAAVLLHRLGRLEEAERAYDQALGACKPESLDVLPVLRGIAHLLRELGRPIVADRYAHMLVQRYRHSPVAVSSFLVDRDQSTAFHEWMTMTEKSRLAGVLRRGLEAEPGVGRVPETFELPKEREALLRFAAEAPKGLLYIVKPARGSGGQGISVTADAASIADRQDVVVQRYIDRPFLVDGRKGHLRIYALVTSAQPLRAYIYSEGIVRFAPEPYDPDPARLADVSMHITNTALHHGHAGLMISEDPTQEDVGAIWSVSAVLKRMAAAGLDPDGVFGEIRQLIAWFLRQVEREGLFARQATHGSPRAFGPKLIGFDVLVDADGHPWLIEMQTNPAATGSALVNKINGELFANIFRMSVGVHTHDTLTPAELEAIRTDPQALRTSELKLERDRRGRFVPLFD